MMIRREIYSNPGSPIKKKYALQFQKDGSLQLKESGQENWQEYIQSFAESTDINTIVTRLAAGDVSVLSKSTGSFGDFTEMPKTLAEFMQLEIDCKNLFDSLPLDVRKEFDMDKNKFLAQAGDIEWFDKVKDSLTSEMKEKVASFKIAQSPIDVQSSLEDKEVTE